MPNIVIDSRAEFINNHGTCVFIGLRKSRKFMAVFITCRCTS